MSRDIHEMGARAKQARQRVSRSLWGVWGAMTRTKSVDVRQLQDTELKRCLSVVDLTALGVGSTLGAGIYVLTGQVARNQAGPAIVLSFLVAAVASLLAGICYAELAARVPRAGSAYIYSYVSVGELWAFVIGWNMILENMIGAASVGKAWSQYFDSMLNDTIRLSIEDNIGGFRSPGLGEFPDFLAFGLLIVATSLVAVGVKMSSVVSFVFTCLNLLVIACIIVIGFYHADGSNWTDHPNFFPYGFKGVLAGAATCFYAFVGFDTIATSGEEAKKPTQNIPSAIVATLIICFIAYFGVSSALTLMVPWNELQEEAALPKAFAQKGIFGAEYVIAVGGMCGLTAAMMGSIFPLPRTVYAMASDGLLFTALGQVWERTNTPFLATWVCGIPAAVLALLLDLDSLVQMMSIGTLMAYTLVAVSVLTLHYQREHVGLTADDIHEDMDQPAAPESGGMKEVQTQPPGREDRNPVGPPPRPQPPRVARFPSNGGSRPYETEDAWKQYQQQDQQGYGDHWQTGDKREEYYHGRDPTQHEDNPRNMIPMQVQEGTGLLNTNQNRTTYTGRTNDAPHPQFQDANTNQYSATNGGKQDGMDTQAKDKEILNRMAGYMDETKPAEGGQHSGSSYSLGRLFQLGSRDKAEPTEHSRRMMVASMSLLTVVWTAICILTVYGEDSLAEGEWWSVMLLSAGCCTVVVCFVVLAKQPRNQTRLNFRVPFVPLIPTFSVMINIYLMITLSQATWIRFVVWMIAGFLIYFGYGMCNSSEKRGEDQQVILYDMADNEGIAATNTH